MENTQLFYNIFIGASLVCFAVSQAGYESPSNAADKQLALGYGNEPSTPQLAPQQGYDGTPSQLVSESVEDYLARQRALGSRNLKFPLPSCYINADGFMCCSKELEKVMDDAYRKISTSRPNWKKCNIQQVSVAVQNATEEHFNVPFEVVVGAGDYASKNYFSQNLICKIKRESSYILAFATPQE